MNAFLHSVVKNILDKEIALSEIVFILPNQRAGVYLKEELKNQIDGIAFLPEIITFDNFAEQITKTPKTSSLQLLFDFYTIYLEETPKEKADSFEAFSGWASIVLDDFNEIDANLISQKDIFYNLKTINEIYNWDLETEMTKNYNVFFQKLEKYYLKFYKFLKENNKGYQGMILREANTLIESHVINTQKHYVFVGFNYLKKSESQIIQNLLQAKKASIFWDISEEMLQKNNSAGHFIRKYLHQWKYYEDNSLNGINSLKFDPNKLTVTGISKNVGMLKYAGELIQKTPTQNNTLVLADQNLLHVALNSLPKNIESVNITMGVPLKNFPLSDLIATLFKLHTQSTEKGFYHQNLLNVLQHPILIDNINEISELIQKLKKKNKVYISKDDIESYSNLFQKDDFQQIINIIDTSDSTISFLEKVNIFILFIKEKSNTSNIDLLHKHHLLNRELVHLLTENETYINDLKGLYYLYNKLLYSESITYIGNPDEGVQVMGFLETQVIDFENLIITSVNEGILPKGKHINSFIPFDLRLEYDLPTYKDEDAISNYHFYRLINSAKSIELLYNTETDTFGSGEKSRFITQLLWQYPEIEQQILSPILESKSIEIERINKSEKVIISLHKLAKKGFSPSSLASYIYNPIDFYYRKILRVTELDEIEETVAANTMGTVLHDTLEELYTPFIGNILTEKNLTKLLPIIAKKTKKHFVKTYKNGSIEQGKNRLIFDVVVNFIKRFIKKEILEVKKGKLIKILALEQEYNEIINFPAINFPIKITGKVDRIEEVDGVLKIVDYKSGKVEVSQLRLDDFNKILLDYKYSKGMQLLIYAYLFTKKHNYNFTQELQAGIISFKNLKAGFMPVNFANKGKNNSITAELLDNFLISLQDLFLEIYNDEIPFEAVIR